MPHLRHKDVQNWEGIALITILSLNKGWIFSRREYPALFRITFHLVLYKMYTHLYAQARYDTITRDIEPDKLPLKDIKEFDMSSNMTNR